MTPMVARRALVVAVALGLVACSSSRKSSGPPRQPSYSTVPCAEQCGNDPNCNASCTPVTNQAPLPSGVAPLK